MIKEEWRLHTTLIGGLGSGFFPILIFGMTLICVSLSPTILYRIDSMTIIWISQLLAFGYGLFVGSLGQIGQQSMTRRFGQLNLLVQLPQSTPVSIRRIVGIFFIKDALYYIVYTILPILLGLVGGAIIVNISVTRALELGLATAFSILGGMALSFLISSLSTRGRIYSGIFILLIAMVSVILIQLHIIQPSLLLPSVAYFIEKNSSNLIISMIISIIFTFGAIVSFKDTVKIPFGTYNASLIKLTKGISIFIRNPTLFVKEALEVNRSGTLLPIITGFIGPLIGLYSIVWLFRITLSAPIDFNLVFYGGLVGFMGVMTYSWLNNTEPNEFLNYLPIRVDAVIKAKLSLYTLIASFSTFFIVVCLGILENEIGFIPVALCFSLANMIYIVSVSSYLTGLWTNTMLFDIKTMTLFSFLSLPPLILGILGSFLISVNSTIGYVMIGISILVSLCLSLILLKRLESRWKNAIFSFVYKNAVQK